MMAFGGGVALLACSSDDAKDKYGSAEAFCNAKAEEECKAVAERCAVPSASCTQKRVSVCTALGGTASTQGRTYVAANAEGCIAKTSELLNSASITREKELETTDACERVFQGTKKASEACTVAAPDPNRTQAGDCEGDLICDRGFCASKREVELNKPCGNPGEVCAKGAYCQQRGTSSFCTAKNTEGQSCKADAPCVEELRCVNFCVAKNEAGGFCDNDGECTTGFCDLSTSPRKCAAKSFASGAAICKEYGAT
jgi:hypothetical protein